MVGGVVDSVHTNGVDAQLGEFLDVSVAARFISNGISNVRGATRLVIDTTDVESVAIGKES